mmetsp:Transcript_16087/g.33774  ORF Transcript_16087/g.33774 Transcript_16087/m.33774 type:complete len:410 (-) Transcript_16087:133-1362(-)|eukprot:CAMPEP_0171328078 /NCGR_PEP_ID=MMETSP0878-20121228/432_1 /TAXON_ID=67004 /ORGANISM="Thalassiosira weissflogii, Strain CCMP1336" /LENGTH=409 /DNA_ID=CAMNT_0011827903 /DNA_START=161 /DNA_END=1390 /DNA_ORIENTATION=+
MSTDITSRLPFKTLVGAVVGLSSIPGTTPFAPPSSEILSRFPFTNKLPLKRRGKCFSALFADTSDSDDYTFDPNRWISIDDENFEGIQQRWDQTLASREDGLYWSSFESNEDDTGVNINSSDKKKSFEDDGGEEAWLDALASIAADEINFMAKEADRADKVRQMQEMGFSADSISATLGVAIDEALEKDPTNTALEAFKEETSKTGFGMYVDDDVDLQTVESHTKVEWDDEANEPVRSQMVYVDEVTCIGCTNCAMIAQSTFFMEGEHGRARVFQQWGDDDETIAVAIQTCPVDCIHYVSYDELKRLEIERRGQNINFKARLVNQGEYRSGAGYQAKYGGGALFTDQQVISGNMGSRCNNCPSRGCKNCPMYGVGKNPEFIKKEKKRKERLAKAKMKTAMESQNKRAEL